MAFKEEKQNGNTKILNNLKDLKKNIIDKWYNDGYINDLRSQIRSKLIWELNNKINNDSNITVNDRIMNTIVIDYLIKYKYNYTLSVFKSEIGGYKMGSLSFNDTIKLLKLNNTIKNNDNTCILKYFVDYHEKLNKLYQNKLKTKINEMKHTIRNDIQKEFENEKLKLYEMQQQLQLKLDQFGMYVIFKCIYIY